MTDAERRLLIWCAVLQLRTTPLTAQEADEIDELIAIVRRELPAADPAQPRGDQGGASS